MRRERSVKVYRARGTGCSVFSVFCVLCWVFGVRSSGAQCNAMQCSKVLVEGVESKFAAQYRVCWRYCSLRALIAVAVMSRGERAKIEVL